VWAVQPLAPCLDAANPMESRDEKIDEAVMLIGLAYSFFSYCKLYSMRIGGINYI
jgi:hypothetical protein